MNQQPDTPEHLTALRERILACCNEEELRTLCADLGVEYDDLPASGRANKARDLVAFLNRQDRIPELEAILARRRCSLAPAHPADEADNLLRGLQLIRRPARRPSLPSSHRSTAPEGGS